MFIFNYRIHHIAIGMMFNSQLLHCNMLQRNVFSFSFFHCIANIVSRCPLLMKKLIKSLPRCYESVDDCLMKMTEYLPRCFESFQGWGLLNKKLTESLPRCFESFQGWGLLRNDFRKPRLARDHSPAEVEVESFRRRF
jgi:hypothetical protein